MKKAKKLLMFFMVCALSSSISTFSTPTVKAATNTKVNTKTVSQKYAEAMEPGWNLGNTFDSFDTGGDKGEQSKENNPGEIR